MEHGTVTILLLKNSFNVACFILDATEKVYKGILSNFFEFIN